MKKAWGRTKEQFIESFWARVSVMPTGCWEWQGSRHAFKGYGQLRGHSDFPSTKAHRIGWMIKNGPVPNGLHVLHRCDNPPCCNPDHLFLGTNFENIQDRISKGKRIRSHRQKLTIEQVREIRSAVARGEVGLRIAERYGISGRQVTAIGRRECWGYVL